MRPFEITILSGKGGTGKTTVAASFIYLASSHAVSADLDVDASNLHILLEPEEVKREPFHGLDEAVICPGKCVKCGACKDSCRFNAVDEEINIIREKCEGCGVCQIVCPYGAIQMAERVEGSVLVSNTDHGTFVHSELVPGGEGSGKLVSLIRERAKAIAESSDKPLIITDGPPGVGCPVISSLTGTDLALIVTEPSVSGLSDLKRILDLASHFDVLALIIINRFDIDTDLSSMIEDLAIERGAVVIGRIPFDEMVYETLKEGLPPISYAECRAGKEIRKIWKDISDHYINWPIPS